MKIAVLGSGEVAQSLADGFLRHGHDVALGTRDPTQLDAWATEHPQARIMGGSDAAAAGDLVVLCVKGSAAAAALRAVDPKNLAGKVVIDVTNPVSDDPPANGVLGFFTSLEQSLMERLQDEFEDVRFVKAFNSVGASLMVDPQLPGGPPTMFICGNDPAAKDAVAGILDEFGWEAEDLGGVEAARAIEPLCILWCIPGFLRGTWEHAFKLLR
jgi:predicted dinucleotide-binding enzyme